MSDLPQARYGKWAVVAGASEGLGAAFATGLAARGYDLLLLARRAPLLAELSEQLQSKHHVTVRTMACDLADPGFADALTAATEGLEVGVAVYNAAYAFIGPFLDKPLEEALRVVDVNVRGPIRFVHALAPAMVARGRGGLVHRRIPGRSDALGLRGQQGLQHRAGRESLG
jgi:short-subunit dehydrogenase